MIPAPRRRSAAATRRSPHRRMPVPERFRTLNLKRRTSPMKSWWPKACVTAAALSMALAMPDRAEEKSTDDLVKEIESLKIMMQGIQKDLAEVKAMLARQAQAAPPPAGVGTV